MADYGWPLNQELRRLFEEDQSERQRQYRPRLARRDRRRRKRVEQLLAAGVAISAPDFFHAAMVFQHGETLDDFWRAHELAVKATELGEKRARWLAAASYDRWLIGQGQPQKYGTQYRLDGAKPMLYPVNPATTDDERVRWGVPTLAEAERRADFLPALRGSVRGWLFNKGLALLRAPFRAVVKNLGPTSGDRPVS